MAGTSPSFNATTFRTQILAAMTMGLPNDVEDQPTFRWLVKPTYDVTDPAGYPYNWGDTPISDTAIADLQVTCAVALSGSPTSSEGTDAGEFTELTCRITLLDTQYNQLVSHGGRNPDQVFLGGSTYNIDYVQPSQGLFNVEIYEILATSRDAAAAG